MSVPKIVSMSPLPPQVIQGLVAANAGVMVNVAGIEGLDAEGIAGLVADADVILGDYSFVNPITPEIAAAAKKARLIQQPSVGYQHIAVEACARAGIPVANTAGANDIAVAEHTVMLALALMKRVRYADQQTHAGRWAQDEMIWTKGVFEIHGKTFGIVGMGRIGREVARRLEPFGVKKLYYDVARLDEETEKSLNVAYKPLEDLLRASDVVSIHVPLTEETNGMINAGRLKMMKSSAVLINVARGEVVDEHALAEALKGKRLAGAGIDVFRAEPIAADNPLLGIENAILTPHIAGATNEARQRIINTAIENVARVLRGEKPLHVVNGVP
ncbi:MAG: 2-hydroxyacid dehydrogenase [bacterium]